MDNISVMMHLDSDSVVTAKDGVLEVGSSAYGYERVAVFVQDMEQAEAIRDAGAALMAYFAAREQEAAVK